jgi:hypothetical protein
VPLQVAGVTGLGVGVGAAVGDGEADGEAVGDVVGLGLGAGEVPAMLMVSVIVWTAPG